LKKSLEDHLQRLEAKGVVPQPSRPPFAAPGQPASGAVSSNPSAPREVRPKVPPPPAAVSAPSAPGAGSAVEWVFCGHCGDKIGAGDVYCAHCGSRQPVLGSAGPAGSARVTAQLVVVGTSDMVKPFPLNQDSLLIGRTDPHTGIFPEIDLTLYDPETKVSRRHAMIYRQGEQFLIEDLGSVNGTIVNTISGGQIKLNTKAPRVLSAGDELKLGGTVLKFVTV